MQQAAAVIEERFQLVLLRKVTTARRAGELLLHDEGVVEAVDAARQVVSDKLQSVAAEENSATFELAKKDFEELVPTLNKLARHADITVNIGGVKVGCGALTLASAFMSGPVAPIVAGTVGSVCYAGTAIYDHYRD